MGQIARERLHKRKCLLDNMLAFVRLAAGRVAHSLMPPDRILRESAHTCSFFRCCTVYLDKGYNLHGAWMQASETCDDIRNLTSEQRIAIERIGSQLGAYDAELQLSTLKVLEEELESITAAASEEYRERSRLYSTCSLLVGTLVSLIIL